ncbi:acyltransferase family protein [Arthrobacter sulfonylureivorans]|uniref:acyltransferase family protein n=1 Tax=Arthrobacter sulfonylureivorans TaxID=2486855 RepID=UPI0039E5B471
MSAAVALAPAQQGVRQTWIDQARWAAIILVVVGHGVGMLRSESGVALVVSNFVYMFHIPVLILLAGWGARRAQADGKTLSKVFWQLLVPYVIFQLIAFLANYLLEGDQPSWTFTSQTFGLWFLVALAGWRLLAPWFRGLRFAIPIAVVVALLAGLSPAIDGFLSLSRILVFLPVFLAGPWIVDRVSEWRQDWRLRAAGAAVVGLGAAAVLLLQDDFWRPPFLGDIGYEALEVGDVEGMVWRLVVLAVGTIMATGFMLMLPGRPGAPTRLGAWTARAGQHTMCPYLLHLPLLTIVGATSLLDAGSPTARALVVIGSAVLFSASTVSRPIVLLTRPLVDPRGAWNALRMLKPAGN